MFHTGRYGRGRRLGSANRHTQLYNDTKELFGSTVQRESAPSDHNDDPDVLAIKKEFQVQQDRLLAWGIHWAEKQGGTSSTEKKHDVELDIDEQVDQSGMGEIVAEIMENIKSTLAQSGRLQHPARVSDDGRRRRDRRREANVVISPGQESQEWKEYELSTGRSLLQKLTDSINLLYSLDANQLERKTREQDSPTTAEDKAHDPSFGSVPIKQYHGTAEAVTELSTHPLYIDLTKLKPMHDPRAPLEPPLYEDIQDNLPTQTKSVYYYPDVQIYVLVDLVKVSSLHTIDSSSSVQHLLSQARDLSSLVSGKGLLSWNGHLKVLGFTMAAANSRFGLVYALPAPVNEIAHQQCQTLANTIAATLIPGSEDTHPPLENKFRLAYNIAMCVAGHLAHKNCHGYIGSSNIVFLQESEVSQAQNTIRQPYLLQSAQKLVGELKMPQPLSATVYHHPHADETGYGTVPAYEVYSLGLVLFEIGHWRPLTTFWKPKYDRAALHERFKGLYVRKLASRCGTRYMKVVQKCLSAPEELAEKPTTVEAAKYLLDVIQDLAKCCALDEAGPPSHLDVEVFEALIDSQFHSLSPSKGKGHRRIPRKPVAGTHPHSARQQQNLRQKPPETLRKWPELEIPQEHLQTWNTMLMPRLSKLLKHCLRDSKESCSVSLMMMGDSPEKAKTTICVQCPDTAKVRESICARFKPKSDWGLIICAGDVKRSGQIRSRKAFSKAKRSGLGSRSGTTDSMEKTREQQWQKWPGCGASIGAFTNDQHLPPVSFGGTILVDGQPFGMTVHHMLDDPEEVDDENEQAEDDTAQRSTALRSNTMDIDRHSQQTRFGKNLPELMGELDLYGDGLSDPESDAESQASTIRPDYAVMNSNEDEFFFKDDDDGFYDDEASDSDGSTSQSVSDDEADETGSIGDRPGVLHDRFDDEDFCITQPAMDDVPENFFSDEREYWDEEHLLSHSFGLVHASSGLKRCEKDGIKHEIDWALIRVNEDRLTLVRQNGSSQRKGSSSSKMRTAQENFATSEPPLTAITPFTALAKLRVNSIGRSSGRRQGRISQAMSLLKLPGRTSFSQSYTVEGGAGMPGDSGAWLYSEDRQELCGHILAWSDTLHCGYLAPMEVLIEDLKERLGAEKVELPTSARLAAEAELRAERIRRMEEKIDALRVGKENIPPADSAESAGSAEFAELGGTATAPASAVPANPGFTLPAGSQSSNSTTQSSSISTSTNSNLHSHLHSHQKPCELRPPLLNLNTINTSPTTRTLHHQNSSPIPTPPTPAIQNSSFAPAPASATTPRQPLRTPDRDRDQDRQKQIDRQKERNTPICGVHNYVSTLTDSEAVGFGISAAAAAGGGGDNSSNSNSSTGIVMRS